MMVTRWGDRPLVRAVAVAIVTVLLGTAITGVTEQARATNTPGALPAFDMTYVSYRSSYGPVTKHLRWHGDNSWRKTTVSSSGWPEIEGSFIQYEDGVLTRFSALTSSTTREPTCSPDENKPGTAVATIPERWFFPHIYTPEYGWTAAGTSADGYPMYQRGTDIFAVDPDSGLVMEVGWMNGDAYIVDMRVTAVELLSDDQ